MDGCFTIKSEGNVIVAEHMKIIGQFVTERLGESFLALVLVGSFGRGEGSIILHENGRIETINDYDLFIILKNGADDIPRNVIAEWEAECANLTGIQLIDFATIPEDYLSRMPISQANFDLKWGGQVVAGRNDLLERIPKFRQEGIRLKDALDLLNTRFWCFIGSKPQKILNEEKSLSQEDYSFVVQQMSKAMVACGESLLILGRQYAVKYSEKAHLILSSPAIPDNDRPLIGWGYSYKLGKTLKPPEGYDLKRLFLEGLHIHLKTWNYIQQKTPFFKGRFFARLYSGMLQFLLNGSFKGFQGVLLDEIQLRFLYRMRNAPLAERVRPSDSVLLWLHCRGWIVTASSYAARVAELRLK